MSNHPPERESLVRGLRLFDATMIVVGSMIGSGIFLVSAESARLTGAPGWLFVAWGTASLMTLLGAACCAELAGMLPRAGGQYVFFREAYGESVAFVYGWAMLIVIQTGTIAAVAVAFAKYLGVLIPWVSDDRYLVAPIHLGPYALSLSAQQTVACGSILTLTALNLRGLETGKWIQNSMTSIKSLALVLLIFIGLTLATNSSSAARTSSWWDSSANGWSVEQARPGLTLSGPLTLIALLGLSMVGPMFSQTAWNNVTFTGEEVRDPERNLPRSLLLGCSIVVALYLLANGAYVMSLSWQEIQHAPSDRVATAVMQKALGPIGVSLMAIAIVISTFGCNNGLILAGSRVFFAMARDGLLLAPLARLNRRRVPGVALALVGLWASILVLPRTVLRSGDGGVAYGNVYTQLLEYVVAAELVFYILMVASVMVLRRRQPALPRPFRAPLYPMTPLLYGTLAALVLADQVWLAPATAGAGFVLVLSGVPLDVARRWFGRSRE